MNFKIAFIDCVSLSPLAFQNCETFQLFEFQNISDHYNAFKLFICFRDPFFKILFGVFLFFLYYLYFWPLLRLKTENLRLKLKVQKWRSHF